MTKKTICVFLAVFTLCLTCALVFLPTSGFAGVSAQTLKQGSSGETVKTIQTKLKNWGYYTGTADGIYGPKTVAAVKAFQTKNKLTADGVVGAKTAAAMGVTLTSNANTGTSKPTGGGATTSSSDLYLLSACIYGEARGESYQGKVAVGAVIKNRIKNPSFPNSIAGVIYQPGAFTCVDDGQINLGTNDECTRAAQAALSGQDPTGGCIYYYNPKTATNQWIRSRKIVTTIGKHVFCL